jgi:hypothetical protein
LSDDRKAETLNAHLLANWESIRHLEGQRAQFTSIAISIFTVLLGVVGLSEAPERRLLAYGAIAAVGILGLVVLAKLFERILSLVASMDDLARRLDALDPSLELRDGVARVETLQRKRHPLLSRLRYGAVWSWAFRLMALGGLAGLAVEGGLLAWAERLTAR